MTPERWRQVQDLFHEALERPPAERAAFLAAACAGDAELRAEVERMLAADTRAEGLLGAVPAALVVEPPAGAPADRAGERIGPYRIVRELGRGGMGTVYLAEREDVRMEVALKLVRGDLAAPEHRARLLLERRVLARLDHPHIARLLDAGVTPDGTPYYVMERVEGEPIDRFCDARRLSIRERLGLFAQVCDAVQYAHQQLVVHRDLKPSNILVQDEERRNDQGGGRSGAPAPGTVKLLDFGIAKLLEDAERDARMVTGTGVRMLTPEYAAPEQVRGDPVSTATDVYALGLLLYELLTGQRAYGSAASTPAARERLVLEAEPQRPSDAVVRPRDTRRSDGTGPALDPDAVSTARRTTPTGLRRVLRGDLDTLVLKALEKEPVRRYASAQQLLDDLVRYRQGRPLLARPATRLYRAGKYIRRHPVGVAVATVFVLLLGGVGVSLELQRAAANRALLEAQKAEETTELLAQLFDASDPRYARGAGFSAAAVLEWGERRVAALDRFPETQAQVLTRIAEAYVGLGLYGPAYDVAERALAIRRRLYSGDHPQLATSLWWMALKLTDRAEFDDSERLFRESLAMRRRLLAPDDTQVIESLGGLAFLLIERGELHEAERVLREALDLDPEGPSGRRSTVPDLRMILGWVLVDQGRFNEAETPLRAGVAAARARLGGDHPFVLNGLSQLGRALQGQGRPAEAEPVFREAVETSQRVQGEAHPRFAIQLHHYAGFRWEQGDLDGAEALARRALAIQRHSLPSDHHWTIPTLALLGQILTDAGRAAEALPFLRDAVTLAEQRLPPAHYELARARSELGACLASLGRTQEAAPLLEAGLASLREALGHANPLTRRARERHEAFVPIS